MFAHVKLKKWRCGYCKPLIIQNYVGSFSCQAGAVGRGMRTYCTKAGKSTFQKGKSPLRDKALEVSTNYKHISEISFVLASLKECSNLKDVHIGTRIHAGLIHGKNDANIAVANSLVHMYAKCGSMVDACRVFDTMQHHNVVSWNTIMFGYIENGQYELALQLFSHMQGEGFRPDCRTYVSALKACTACAAKMEGKEKEVVKKGYLEKGLSIHSQIVKDGHELDIFLASTLVDMYAKCGSMVHAWHVFNRMPHHDVVSWCAMVFGYAESGDCSLALQLFTQMQNEGYIPNPLTYVAALKACSTYAAKEEGKQVKERLVKTESLEKGMAIHSQLAKHGHEFVIFVANSLIDMYSKCGSLTHAHYIFQRMTQKDVVSWSTIIFGHAESGDGGLALQLFELMQDKGYAPNSRTFVAVLKACAGCAEKEEGREVGWNYIKLECLERVISIHSRLRNSVHGLDIFVENMLIDTYGKCGSIMYARQVFDRMSLHNVVSYNAMISGYAENGESSLALQLFLHMQEGGLEPDTRTYVAALKACVLCLDKEEGDQNNRKLRKVECIAKGKAIHSKLIKRRPELDSYVASTLVDMYAKNGSIFHACWVFDRMLRHDVVSWNAVLFGYVESGEDKTLYLSLSMQNEGFMPDALTYIAALKACANCAKKEAQTGQGLMKIEFLEKGLSIHSQLGKSGHDLHILVASTLVDMYSKCGSMVHAHKVFDTMLHWNVVSWNAMLFGYAENGNCQLTLEFFLEMRAEGITPNSLTYVATLKACSNLSVLEIGMKVHVEICRVGFQNDLVVTNALLGFYGKCGRMADAEQVFSSMHTKNLVTWNTLLAGYAHHGDVEHVFDIFGRMQEEELELDGITFLSVLTTCSHAGLVDEGKEYFKMMCSHYLITPTIEHYACMIDLLGRAGRPNDVVVLVGIMPLKPNLMIWRTMLDACARCMDQNEVVRYAHDPRIVE